MMRTSIRLNTSIPLLMLLGTFPPTSSAAEINVTAQRVSSKIRVNADGINNAQGFTNRLEELPLDVYPPRFKLVSEPPTKKVGQLATPFNAVAEFPADESAKEVIVETLTGEKKARVTTNIKEALEEYGNYKTLLMLFDAANLNGEISGQINGTITLFAPTDEAFKKLPKSQIDNLLKDKQLLRKALLYHIFSGTHSRKRILSQRSVATLSGEVQVRNPDGLNLSESNPNFTAYDVEVGIAAINVIIPMDGVLIP